MARPRKEDSERTEVQGVSLVRGDWSFLKGLGQQVGGLEKGSASLAIRHLVANERRRLANKAGEEPVRFKVMDSPKITLYRPYDTSTGELGDPEPWPSAGRKRTG